MLAEQTVKLRVLVVDDSSFFRNRLGEILAVHPLLEIVGKARDGAQAVAMNRELQPDVITMDVHMPVMDGIEAARTIMRDRGAPILMLSSLTSEGAQATLDALDAGAMDFLPKQLDQLADSRHAAARIIRRRVVALGLRHRSVSKRVEVKHPAAVGEQNLHKHRLVLIGASTGGPIAVQQILTGLRGQFPLPLVIVQHMPAAFTATFATRLDRLAQIRIKEAEDGEQLCAGTAYIAPGGRQFEIRRQREHAFAGVVDAPPAMNYKPSIDVAFQSAAGLFPGEVLAVVLTGMGSDGCEGAKLLKDNGSTVWAQDEASSVIYGMPKAIARAGVADQIMSLQQIAGCLQSGAP